MCNVYIRNELPTKLPVRFIAIQHKGDILPIRTCGDFYVSFVYRYCHEQSTCRIVPWIFGQSIISTIDNSTIWCNSGCNCGIIFEYFAESCIGLNVLFCNWESLPSLLFCTVKISTMFSTVEIKKDFQKKIYTFTASCFDRMKDLKVSDTWESQQNE